MVNVLIVEDSPTMEQIVKFNLESVGYTVVGRARNGQEAFDKYRELRPDIVLMDLMMPKVDGKTGIRKVNCLH